MSLASIFLAPDRLERMGRPQSLLRCAGTTFLGAILLTLASSNTDVISACYWAPGRTRFEAPSRSAVGIGWVNQDYWSGMLSAVWCGVGALSDEVGAIFDWPVDHPLVSAQTIDVLIERHTRSAKGIAIPGYATRRGHPADFASQLRNAIVAAPLSIGLRAMSAARPDDIIEVSVEDHGVIADVDAQADFDRWVWTPRTDCFGLDIHGRE